MKRGGFHAFLSGIFYSFIDILASEETTDIFVIKDCNDPSIPTFTQSEPMFLDEATLDENPSSGRSSWNHQAKPSTLFRV
ncbi:hypothetical protein BDQ17DRAFT_1343094 [Cyathus striatus]|nr:hypothetical protein BDQ17DRAFT_1343094 [Cyathus striatus]